jgi:hypothetical protein
MKYDGRFTLPTLDTPAAFSGVYVIQLSLLRPICSQPLVQGYVPEHFMTEPFNLFFQMRLAAPEFDEHLTVVIRAMEQCLVDLIFEPLKISNEGGVRHVVLHDPE